MGRLNERENSSNGPPAIAAYAIASESPFKRAESPKARVGRDRLRSWLTGFRDRCGGRCGSVHPESSSGGAGLRAVRAALPGPANRPAPSTSLTIQHNACTFLDLVAICRFRSSRGPAVLAWSSQTRVPSSCVKPNSAAPQSSVERFWFEVETVDNRLKDEGYRAREYAASR